MEGRGLSICWGDAILLVVGKLKEQNTKHRKYQCPPSFDTCQDLKAFVMHDCIVGSTS